MSRFGEECDVWHIRVNVCDRGKFCGYLCEIVCKWVELGGIWWNLVEFGGIWWKLVEIRVKCGEIW
jgi:hypothetical protein